MLIDLLNGIIRKEVITCITILCDTVYLSVFEGSLFKRTINVPFVMVGYKLMENSIEHFPVVGSNREISQIDAMSKVCWWSKLVTSEIVFIERSVVNIVSVYYWNVYANYWRPLQDLICTQPLIY